MKLENLRKEAPQMPQDIRVMIEKEVAMQMQKETKKKQTFGKSGKMTWKKAAVFAAAATLTVGTTVFAGEKLHQWRVEQEGQYAILAGMNTPDSTPAVEPVKEAQVLTFKPGYLPEGMIGESDGYKFFNSDTPYQGGISLGFETMTEDFSTKKWQIYETDVLSEEMLTIGEHEALYLKKPSSLGDGDGVIFDKTFYVAYPEYGQILFAFVGEDLSKEEAVKILEGIEVTPTGETMPLKDSSYDPKAREETSSDLGEERKALQKLMQQPYKLGEELQITEEISAKVTKVELFDDLSPLKSGYVDEELQKAVDENGRLRKDKVSYIKAGNHVDTLDEVVKTEETDRKLVYTTVELKNTSEHDLKDVLYYAEFAGITEDSDGYSFYDRAVQNGEKIADGAYSDIGICGFGEMDYFDVQGGENKNGNNYISSIKAGETVTVHIAKLMRADELDKMYLAFQNDYGEPAGYIDIRS